MRKGIIPFGGIALDDSPSQSMNRYLRSVQRAENPWLQEIFFPSA